MFIKKLQLQNFKRFTNLSIDLGGSIAPKLVLLIWANGSGKSSILDAFQATFDLATKGRWLEKNFFIKKNKDISVDMLFDCVNQNSNVQIHINDNHIITWREFCSKIYCRPSIRIVPTIQWSNDRNDDSVNKSIDFESRFHNDVFSYIAKITERINRQIFQGDKKDDNSSINAVREEFINPFNESLKRIFWLSDDILLQLIDYTASWPNIPSNLLFGKGSSIINYENLSHGEKQVIIIILNFIIRKEELTDKVIFIDEMDIHLHTSLQYNLLKEITEYRLPNGSQLRTASHALWFIDYAKQSPGGVIIDFDNLDFDQDQELTPRSDRRVFDIAVPEDMLAILFKNKSLVYCENTNDEYYNSMWIDNMIFVGETNRDAIFLRIEKEWSEWNLWIIDRDYITSSERKVLLDSLIGLRILDFYCFENYLYHPDNIAELIVDFDKDAYIQDIISYKNTNLMSIGWKVIRCRQSMIFLKDQKPYFAKHAVEQWEKEIVEELQSNDFEKFYRVFSMKDYNKSFLSKYNIDKSLLSKTIWIKTEIQELI